MIGHKCVDGIHFLAQLAVTLEFFYFGGKNKYFLTWDYGACRCVVVLLYSIWKLQYDGSVAHLDDLICRIFEIRKKDLWACWCFLVLDACVFGEPMEKKCQTCVVVLFNVPGCANYTIWLSWLCHFGVLFKKFKFACHHLFDCDVKELR